jgi:hypothetical protein
MDKYEEAQNRLYKMNDVTTIHLGGKRLSLIANEELFSRKQKPVGKYSLYACKTRKKNGDSLHLSPHSKLTKPSEINGLSQGSVNHVGSPTELAEPNAVPVIYGRPDTSLTIALDSEWTEVGSTRNILSYQFVTVIPDGVYDVMYALIIFPYASQLDLGRCLNIFLEYIWKNHKIVVKPTRDDKKSTVKDSAKTKTIPMDTLHIQIVSHFGGVDISAFRNTITRIFPQLIPIQKTVVSSRNIGINLVDANRHERKASLAFRDTMLLSVGGGSLADVGNVVGISKLDNPYRESNMNDLILINPKFYNEYALNDSLIALEYAKVINEGYYHKRLPMTISSESCKIIKDGIMAANNWTSSEFDRYFRGLEKQKRSSQNNSNGGPSYSNQLVPISSAADILDTATYCYMGGCNTAYRYGFEEEHYWDYDLSDAYPSGLSMSPDIDFLKAPLIYANQDITSLISNMEPSDYGFGLIDFEFPETCKYPCIPIYDVNGHGLIYVRKGKTFASHPEVYLAVMLGAKINADKWLVPMTTEKYSLRTIYSEMINTRRELKETYGQKSFQELKQKLINNSGYGNIARGITLKKSYSPITGQSEYMPPSDITSAPYASHGTSFIRATLLAAVNGISNAGYTVLHATTDGLMSNIPIDKLTQLSLYGFTDTYMETLKSISEAKSMWEDKHDSDLCITTRTRCNVGLSTNGRGNSALAGYKYTEEEKLLPSEERNRAMIHKILSRQGPLVCTYPVLPSVRDVIEKGKDYVGIKKTSCISMDWDWKRKLTDVAENIIKLDDCVYYHLHADSAPYDTIEEYNRYINAKSNISVLVTMDDYQKYLFSLHNQDSNTRNTGSTQKNIARSILRYIRSGQLIGFDELNGVQICGKVSSLLNVELYPNDWKKALQHDRIRNVLPLTVLDPYISQLGLTVTKN